MWSLYLVLCWLLETRDDEKKGLQSLGRTCSHFNRQCESNYDRCFQSSLDLLRDLILNLSTDESIFGALAIFCLALLFTKIFWLESLWTLFSCSPVELTFPQTFTFMRVVQRPHFLISEGETGHSSGDLGIISSHVCGAKTSPFPVFFVPKPNQTISTALPQHKNEPWT